jgi:hypothetical protein
LLGTLRPEIDQAFVITQVATNNTSAWPNWSTSAASPGQRVLWNSNSQDFISFVRALHWGTATVRTPEIARKMFALDPGQQFRRILVEFRDPQTEVMGEWGYIVESELEASQLKEIADYQRENLAVYTIALATPFSTQFAGPPATETMSRANAAYLAYKAGEATIERVATTTGGRYFPSSGDFRSDIAKIQKDLQNQFIVSFVPQIGGKPGRPHKLKIQANRKNLRVTCQDQYYPTNP